MLNKLNYSGIKRFPKWVVGFSDITALHAALQVNGIASVHGPMAKHLSDEGAEDEAVRYMRSLLFGESVEYRMPVRQYDILNRRGGTAEGRLFGGNLSVFCALMGTKFVKIPPNKGILFIEDIGEAPYRVDRMIYQLKLSGVFEKPEVDRWTVHWLRRGCPDVLIITRIDIQCSERIRFSGMF